MECSRRGARRQESGRGRSDGPVFKAVPNKTPELSENGITVGAPTNCHPNKLALKLILLKTNVNAIVNTAETRPEVVLGRRRLEIAPSLRMGLVGRHRGHKVAGHKAG